MLLEEFDPLHDEMVTVLDNDGNVTRKDWKQPVSDEEAVDALKQMLFARQADLMTVSYQRQGRMYTYPPNQGQEAIQVAAGMVTRRDDWLVPAFRELATWLAKGITLKELFLFWRGHEEASRFENAPHTLPISVPVASQIPHAAGVGFAVKKAGTEQIVCTFVGDGGVSEGDFHEGLNFAGVWKAPVVFVVQNNQFAISVPSHDQTASRNIAAKAHAYGMPGVMVDGNDFFASYEVMKEAADYARGGNGPVLVEAVTYRKGAHTTSDDPSRYRTKEEEEEWERRDPISRLRAYLQAQNKWSENEKQLLHEYRKEIDRQFVEAENHGPYELDDVFQWQYAQMPEELRRQKVAYERFLNWKEARA
ncbi:MAG: pyruvate dehydrogenase (acetyl-transferring) E1 component subunit alpha [Spirochaetaceae bacterium]